MAATSSQTSVGELSFGFDLPEPAERYIKVVRLLLGDGFKHVENAIKEWWHLRLDSSSFAMTIATALASVFSLQHLDGLNHLLTLKEDPLRIRTSIGQYEDDFFVLTSSSGSKIYHANPPDIILAYTSEQLVQLEGTISTDNILNTESAKWAMQLLQSEVETTRIPTIRRRYWKLLQRLVQQFHFLPPSFFLRNLTCQGNQITGGGFSDIWKGQVGNETVCIKVLRIFEVQDSTITLKKFCEEALMWRQLRHPNILPFLGVNTQVFSPRLCLVSPWMPNGNIIEFLKGTPDHDRLSVITEIAEGLAYLHSMSPAIVHGDIKGVNILVTNDRRCCLADFGLAVAIETKTFDSSSTRREGTMRWLAPEVIQPSDNRQVILKPARDVYAFGCTVYEVFTGQVPFADYPQDMAVMLAVLEGKRPTRPPGDTITDTVWTLMESCWAQDPANRPTAARIAKSLRYIRSRRSRQGFNGELGRRTVIDFEHQAELRQYHERLVFEPWQATQLDLLGEERILIHSGNLIAAGEERHVVLLDNYLLITTPEEHDGIVKYRIFGQPILVRLISLLDDFNQRPEPLDPFKPTKSFYHLAVDWGQNTRRYPNGDSDRFIYSPIYFYFESSRIRTQWQTAFNDAISIDHIVEQENRMFKLEALSFEPLGTKITCSVLFNTVDARELVAIGCDNGVWIGAKRDPTSMRHVLHLNQVGQCAILEELGVFLVLADSSLFAYHIGATSEESQIPQKLSGKHDVVFFSIGQISGQIFVIYMAYGDCYMFHILQPVPGKINESPGTRVPSGIRSLFRRSPKSGSEWFNVYKKLLITETWPNLWKPFDIVFLQTQIAIVYLHSIELVNLNNLNSRKHIPDEGDPSHAQLLRRSTKRSVVGMFRVTDDESLLVYNDFGVYINSDGNIRRPDSIVEWELWSSNVALRHPYILLFARGDRFLEVRELGTGALVQVMKLSAERLWDGYGRLIPRKEQSDQIRGEYVHVEHEPEYGGSQTLRCISELAMIASSKQHLSRF